MDRRSFVRGAGLVLLGASSWCAVAQRTGALPRIGVLTSGTGLVEPPFWQGMRELGYVEGKTIIVDRRSADDDLSRLPALADELVRARPAVIVAIVTAATIAASRATRTIPIVMVAVGDPVAAGVVGNLARPGGNVTGTSGQATAAIGKQIEIIRQVLPRATRIAMLWNPANAIFQQQLLGEALTAAAKLQLLARILDVRNRDGLDSAFAAMSSDRPDAVLVFLDPVITANVGRLVELSLAHRLPTFGGSRPVVEAGVLASYGSDLTIMAHRAAIYVQKILKGARPGELAIEQPTKFELIVNLRTAKALGIDVPAALVARADEVIR